MKKVVLLIEDSHMCSKLVSDILINVCDCEVILACDGESGWDIINSKTLDLIITDVRLPDVCGLDIIERVKGDEALRHIPVIAVTACTMVGDREKCIKAGCDRYVSKPVDISLVISVVNEFLNKD